jgi:hypothetical protein
VFFQAGAFPSQYAELLVIVIVYLSSDFVVQVRDWICFDFSSGQALEIGECAISFLMKTWEGHLTPPEVANLADRASRSRDPGLVRVAAELALSVLPHAHALNPNEIQTAITQVCSISQFRITHSLHFCVHF